MNFRFPQVEPRRGQSLVEFALVALVVYLLMAAIITFGFALFAAQTNQQIVDVAAREIARTPLPLNDSAGNRLSLFSVLYSDNYEGADDFHTQVFDETKTVLVADDLETLEAEIQTLPIVNRMLTTLMFLDTIDGQRVLRYPGVILSDGQDMVVRVPVAESDNSIGIRRIIEPSDSRDIPDAGGNVSSDGPFQLTSEERGIVSLRLNYPFQSAVMSEFEPNPEGPFEPTIGNPVLANDAAGAIPDAIPSDRIAGPYTGPNGLGRQLAFAEEVRPFTKLIVNQAVYRREVFR